MHIGIDARILGHRRSGIAVYAINLIEQFLGCKDLQITLFSDRPICQEYRYLTDKVQTVVFGQKKRKLWAQFYLPGQLKKYKIDVYHAVWNSAVPIIISVPSVLTVHDIIPLVVPGYFKNRRKRFKYIFSMRSALARAKVIIADAQNTKADLIKYFNVSKEKIKVIHLGIKREFLPPHLNPLLHNGGEEMVRGALNKFGITSDYIINIGSFDKRRNLDILLRAFAVFIGNSNADCRLVLIGRYDSFAEEINRLRFLINELSLKRRVIFTGYVSEAEKFILLSKARMMAHFSLYEGFCFPALEAMRAGIPVAASNTGSVPEVVGDAAVLANPADERDIVRAIGKLWNDKKLADELVKKGYERIKDFSWEKTAEETLKIYEKIFQTYKIR